MKTITLALVSTLFASTAFAADAIESFDPPAPSVASAPETSTPSSSSFSWDGAYVGINGGYAGGKFKRTLEVTDIDGSASATNSSSYNGFSGGVQAGYNWQFDKVVAGIEADFQGGSLKKDTSFVESADSSLTVNNRLDWYGTARARVGYTVTPTTLVYTTGGLAYGKIKTGLEYTDGDITEANSWSKTKAGYTIGGGTEFGLTDEITLKTEYLYTDFGKAKMFNYSDSTLNEGINGKSKVNLHTIRAGINYKF